MRQCPRSPWPLPARGLSAIKSRLCIAAASGGGGKTLLSLGLCRIYRNAGISVKPFKKGPDYIDAAWLAAAAGDCATNLDPFFMDRDGIRQLFAQAMQGQDLGIIEGNRGLYDGLNASGSCSTSQIARTLAAPILLCLDCRKMTRTACALLNGLTGFEPGLTFAGVVLNRTGSGRHEASLRAAIEANTDLPVLGCLPRLARNPLPERHMGIACQGPALAEKLEERLEQIAAFVKENCDTGAILQAARNAPALDLAIPSARQAPGPDVKIGIARDQALWFYYPENISCLEQAGAEIIYLSLFDRSEANKKAWQNLDGLYLGGGFPEDYCAEIAASPWLDSLRKFAADGMPIYAECGGMIVLAARFRKGGAVTPMAGVFSHDIIWSEKPQGLGYVEANVSLENPWHEAGTTLRGHEFHYSLPSARGQILTLERGTGTGKNSAGQACDGFCKNRVWASYMHIFGPAVPEWAATFVRLAREYRRELAADADHLAACDCARASLGQNL